MTKTRTRFFAVGLAIAVLLASLFIVPTPGKTVSAEEPGADVWDGSTADKFDSGSGTKGDPYIISNGAQLAHLAEDINVNCKLDFYEDKYIKLGADIDLNYMPWTPIGYNANQFAGVFDGDGHTISHMKTVGSDSTEKSWVGLFGKTSDGQYAECGTIKNLTVADSIVTGDRYVGAVAGNAANIVNCKSINNTVTGNENVGGVCGEIDGNISLCYNNSTVSGVKYVGGVFGSGRYSNSNANEGSYTVEECYNTGSVTCTGSGADVGGVAGFVEHRKATDCLNTGDITAENCGDTVGGVFGRLTNADCDSAVNTGAVNKDSSAGTVVGVIDSSTITNAYYDSTKCTLSNANGTGLSTEELIGDVPSGLGSSWTAGKTEITNISGRHATQIKRYISLKNIGEPSPVGSDTPLYNFSQDGTPVWETYVPIATVDDLNAISSDLGGNYVMTGDITDGGNVRQIGDLYNSFSGKFSGDGHTISGLFMSEDRDYIGLFYYNRGIIMELNVKGTIVGNNFTGGICALNDTNSKIINCSFDGDIDGSEHVGGICGQNQGNIIGCRSAGKIVGPYDTGGICGYNVYGGSITTSWNEAEIFGVSSVGGICGESAESSTISTCYNVGDVSGDGYLGGILGLNRSSSTVADCYSAGNVDGTVDFGVVCGYSENTNVTNCYYNNDIFGGTIDSDIIGTPLTAVDMLSSDALDTMKLTDPAWVKKPNDKASHTAYYPSFSEETATAVKYTSGLSLEVSKDPVYGGDVKFTAKALIKYGENLTSEDSNGEFTLKLGNTTIVTSDEFSGNIAEWTATTAGKTTLTLEFSSTSSEFHTGKLTENFVIDIAKKVPAASDFTIATGSLEYNGRGHNVSVSAKQGMGKFTVKYYSDGKLLDSAPVNAGTYTFKIDADEGEFYSEKSDITDTDWEFTIAAAQAQAIPDNEISYSWGVDDDITVTVAGLPDDMGEVGNATVTLGGDDIFKPDSALYSDGKCIFHLGPNTSSDAGKVGYITVDFPTQNYGSITFRIAVTLNDKGVQNAPDDADFELKITDSGNGLTAEIITELEGVEFSFNGVDWSSVNSVSVGHDELVTGYIRFAETDEFNSSAANSKTVRSGHGALVRHERVEPDCTKEGNIEYWECKSCGLYFLDENGGDEVALENTVLAITGHTSGNAVKKNVIPATCTTDGSYDEVIYCTVCNTEISSKHITVPAPGHKWSEKYTYDKTGHWHKCENCDAETEVEAHVSSGAATTSKAETCTICGYVIAPRKTSGGGTSAGGSRPSATPIETRPSINGTQKSWADIAADINGQNGGNIVISMNGETAIPADVIKSIKDNKIKAEFVIDSTKSWIIDGAKITAAAAADLSILPGNADKSALRGIVGVDIKVTGTGVPAELKLSFRKEFAGQFANVYKLVDNKLVFQSCAKLSADGSVMISGAYSSGEYVVMVCEFSDLPGDMNNDGAINAHDAAAILKDIVGIVKGANPLMSDFNGDGIINALDASAILKKIVNIAV